MKITATGYTKKGKMYIDDRSDLMEKVSEKIPDAPLLITIERYADKKTLQQIRTFYGPICKQVRQYYIDEEGTTKGLDEIKYRLKEKFLGFRLAYFDDGAPVMAQIVDQQTGAAIYVQKTTLPSLADLSKDEMIQFITDIIEYYKDVVGYPIIIDEKKIVY